MHFITPSEKDSNTATPEKRLWEAADQFRANSGLKAQEGMTEEELVIFDLLMRPAAELSPEERNELKRVARDLLTRLKDLLVLNWRQNASARSKSMHLEVKGVMGVTKQFTLTAGEHQRAQSDNLFRLALVTSAKTAPQLHEYDGPTLLRRFEATPIQYRVIEKVGH